MIKTDPINEAAKRAQRYWYQDGLWEIGFGLINLLLGAFYLITSQFNWAGPLSILLPFLQAGVLIGAFWIINRLVGYLKQHITYPRTGYVAYIKPTTRSRYKRAALTGLLAAILGVLVALVSSLRGAENRTAFIVSVVMAAMLIYIGYRFSLVRLYAVAVLTVGLGYAITTFRIPEQLSSAAFFGGIGLLILISGFTTMLFYLRRTRPAGEEADYESPDESQL